MFVSYRSIRRFDLCIFTNLSRYVSNCTIRWYVLKSVEENLACELEKNTIICNL